jgi:hypothetical protein
VRRRWLAPAIAVATVLIGSRAGAQSPSVEAEALFRKGRELLAAKNIVEACAAFDLSQKLDPRTTTLLNQANCREQNGQLATAWALYVEAMRQTRSASDAAGKQLHTVATNRAAKLEKRLSTLRIDVPPQSHIPGLNVLRNGEVFDVAAWNTPLPIDGGAYKIAARAPGATEWSIEVTVNAEADIKRIEVPRLAPIPVAAPVAAGSGGERPRRRQRPCRHLPGAAAGRGRSRGRQRKPRAAHSLFVECRVEPGP